MITENMLLVYLNTYVKARVVYGATGKTAIPAGTRGRTIPKQSTLKVWEWVSYIIYHISYIIYHISCIICHISYIISYISYIVYRISYIVYIYIHIF